MEFDIRIACLMRPYGVFVIVSGEDPCSCLEGPAFRRIGRARPLRFRAADHSANRQASSPLPFQPLTLLSALNPVLQHPSFVVCAPSL